MIYPPLLSGPQFKDGDLVSFTFEDCELTYRVPVVQHNFETLDDVYHINDFRNVNISDWQHHNDRSFLTLSAQNWDFEYETGHQDIISCFLKVTLIKQNEQEINDALCLDSVQFKKFLLEVFNEDRPVSRFPDRIDWPSKDNNFFIRTSKKCGLDGIVAELDSSNSGECASMNAYFALNRTFVITVYFGFTPIHYEDIEYPYSPEFLRQFKQDLFDDFLSHVKIEYSGETLKTIQLKNKTTES